MIIKNAAATLAALTILAGAPAFAVADTAAPESPIVITNLAIEMPATPGSELNSPSLGSVSVEYHNARPVAATDVTFEVDSFGSQVDSIHDVGTFAPGTTIRHRFVEGSNLGHETVHVARVKFADGSIWKDAPDDAPVSLRQQTAAE